MVGGPDGIPEGQRGQNDSVAGLFVGCVDKLLYPVSSERPVLF